MKIIHTKDNFTPRCKIIPIGAGYFAGDETKHQQNIEFFDELAKAVEALIQELSETGVWFESPKIRIDHDNKEILFGYHRALTVSLLQKILITPCKFKDAICYHASERSRKAFQKDTNHRYRLYFIENDLQALHRRNEKAHEKCQKISSSNKRHEEQWLNVASALTRHGLFDAQKESEAEYFNKRFKQCDFLFFGEVRHPTYGTAQTSIGHDYILHYIEALKAAGVTKVYSEYFLKEHQPLIDYYYAAENNPIPIELAQESRFNGCNTLALLRALKENNIKLIGLEDALSVTGAYYTVNFRVDSFNYRALKIIQEHYQPGEKSVVEVGGRFLFCATSIHNLLNVEGFYPRRKLY